MNLKMFYQKYILIKGIIVIAWYIKLFTRVVYVISSLQASIV